MLIIRGNTTYQFYKNSFPSVYNSLLVLAGSLNDNKRFSSLVTIGLWDVVIPPKQKSPTTILYLLFQTNCTGSK